VADEELDSDADGLSPCEGDCDDTNDAVNPSATEDSEDLCADTLDNDCDGDTDIDDSDCDGLVGDDDDAVGDDDDAVGDDDDVADGCDCTVSGTEGGPGYGLLLLGLLGLIRRRRS
jgi:MYXO-CTERM domain-containing protein